MSRFLFLSIIVVILDQLSKQWIGSHFDLHEQRPVIDGVFNLTFACNYGAAFSFLSEAGGWQRWGFGVFAAVVSLVLIIWIVKLPRDKTWLAVSLALILGGAVGNLYDRIAVGCVVDFIQVYLSFIPLRIFNPWPSFNIADSAIFIGAVIYIIDAFVEDRRHKRNVKVLPELIKRPSLAGMPASSVQGCIHSVSRISSGKALSNIGHIFCYTVLKLLTRFFDTTGNLVCYSHFLRYTDIQLKKS